MADILVPADTLTRPLPDLRAWTAHFVAAEIPVLAETAEAIEALRANEDDVDAHLLAETITGDPLMALKVLAHVGSNRSSRVLTDAETVTAALVLMGISPFFRAFWPPSRPRSTVCAPCSSARTAAPSSRSPSRCTAWTPMRP
jgi:hypothetical protein